jgi:hypothetical protein
MRLTTLLALMVVLVAGGVYAQGTTGAQDLPGKGLAQHDFLYAGEAPDRNIYMVRGGKIIWSYSDPAGKGEISDALERQYSDCASVWTDRDYEGQEGCVEL